MLTTQQRRELCAATHLCEKTVKRAYEGARLREATLRLLRLEAERLNLPLPPTKPVAAA